MLAACTGDRPPSPQTASWSVLDSAGVTVVSNHPDQIERGCVTVTPEPVIAIRPVTQRGGTAPPFYKVRGGTVLSDGRIVVLNGGSRQLFFFEADGTYLKAAGGEGRGPGEFVNPTWLGHGDNDTLFVWDSGLSRLSIFDGAGELLTSHIVQASVGDDLPAVIGGRFDDGSFFTHPGGLAFFDGRTGVVRHDQTYGRYDLETAQAERIVMGQGPEWVAGDRGVYELPFGKTDIAIPHGDALVIGDNGTSTLQYYDLAGQLRRAVHWASPPIPVTARDERAERRHIAEIFPAFAHLPADARFADERPRFSSLQSDGTDWLWVQTYAAEWEPFGHWLVFDEAGVLRCRVDLPDRFRVRQIGDRHILGVQRDEWNEESVLLLGVEHHR